MSLITERTNPVRNEIFQDTVPTMLKLQTCFILTVVDVFDEHSVTKSYGGFSSTLVMSGQYESLCEKKKN